jgi:hypothetical protein
MSGWPSADFHGAAQAVSARAAETLAASMPIELVDALFRDLVIPLDAQDLAIERASLRR